jgi:hypothetical protein
LKRLEREQLAFESLLQAELDHLETLLSLTLQSLQSANFPSALAGARLARDSIDRLLRLGDDRRRTAPINVSLMDTHCLIIEILTHIARACD